MKKEDWIALGRQRASEFISELELEALKADGYFDAVQCRLWGKKSLNFLQLRDSKQMKKDLEDDGELPLVKISCGRKLEELWLHIGFKDSFMRWQLKDSNNVPDTIYCIRCHYSGFFKIGVTAQGTVKTRLKQLQTGNPYPLIIYQTLTPNDFGGAATLEYQLKKDLKKLRAKGGTEWFYRAGFELIDWDTFSRKEGTWLITFGTDCQGDRFPVSISRKDPQA